MPPPHPAATPAIARAVRIACRKHANEKCRTRVLALQIQSCESLAILRDPPLCQSEGKRMFAISQHYICPLLSHLPSWTCIAALIATAGSLKLSRRGLHLGRHSQVRAVGLSTASSQVMTQAAHSPLGVPWRPRQQTVFAIWPASCSRRSVEL